MRLGEWEFDLGTQLLKRGEETYRLDPVEIQVLLHLIENAPNLIRTEELLARSWPDVVVGDNVVHRVIARLRKSLGDSSRHPKYIETLSRRGYRFIGDVERPTTFKVDEGTPKQPLIKRPFPAYAGNDPYVFVCYAHVDTALVFPELVWLNEQGYNVWYDEGIVPGNEWTQALADAIEGSSHFLYFVTPGSVESRNCRSEVQFAATHAKSIVPVYLNPTELPGGIELAMGLSQAILKYELSPSDYAEKLTAGMGHKVQKPDMDLLVRANRVSELVKQEHPESIAVLPFVNISSDPDNEFFSDGISEEILNALVKTSRLPVVARTSSFAYKGSCQDVNAIGNALGVTHILEGSVRKAKDDIRITAQLIDAHSGTHLWAETYDRKLMDVFAIQDEIAANIVSQIGLALSSDDVGEWKRQQSSTASAEALVLFLKGMQLANVDDPYEMEKAIPLFEQAITLDENYADAWVGLGRTYLLLAIEPICLLIPSQVLPTAIESFRKALAIHPGNAKALGLLGLALMLQEFKWNQGASLMEQSIAMNPEDVEIQGLYGWFLLSTARKERTQLLDRAYQMNPLDPFVVWARAANIHVSRQPLDEATRMTDVLLSLDPESYTANLIAAFVACMTGDAEKAFRHTAVARVRVGDDFPAIRQADLLVAMMNNDVKQVTEIKAELFARMKEINLSGFPAVPWTEEEIVEVYEIAVEQRHFGLMARIFNDTNVDPALRNMPEEEWQRIRRLTHADEVKVGTFTETSFPSRPTE